jgi:uncharacterized peroxidase-related enzyme
MPRVKEISEDSIKKSDSEIYHEFTTKYGNFENQAKILAHRPPAFRHLINLLLELAKEEILPKRYLEIALVTVSKLNECNYCIVHHTPRLIDYGLSALSANNILEPVVPGFDAVDMLVRDYSMQVTKKPQYINDTIFSELRVHFDDAQIVELTLRISLCGFFNRFNDALQINIENDAAIEFSEINGSKYSVGDLK